MSAALQIQHIEAVHPTKDPDFHNRRKANPENPANNPDFIYQLADRMDENPLVREAVYESFLTGDLSFLFHDVQLEIKEMIDNTSAKEVLIFCSRQLGKSFFILCYAIMHCLTYKGFRKPLVRIFCKTEDQVYEIVSDNMAVIQQIAPKDLIKQKKSDRTWKVGRGEIRLAPMASAHIDGKRGGNATLVILEEGSFLNSESYTAAIGSVINPQLLRSQGKLVHVTTPSKELDHYIHTEVLPKAEMENALAKYTVYDNVQLSDSAIIEAYERCTTGEEWLREYLVKIIKSAISTVIPEFEESLPHVNAMQLPSYAHWLTSLDFGGTVDKHGIVLCFYDFKRAKLCVWDERLLDKNTSTKSIRKETLDMEKWAADRWLDESPNRVSDCPGQILVDLNTEDFYVRTPKKEDGSWEADINAVRLAFTRNEIEIHPRCKWLIATLKYGQYTENRKDFKRTEKLGHLDLLAALKYALRHKNTSNPYPAHVGKSRQTHYLTPEEEESTATLQEFISGDF